MKGKKNYRKMNAGSQFQRRRRHLKLGIPVYDNFSNRKKNQTTNLQPALSGRVGSR